MSLFKVWSEDKLNKKFGGGGGHGRFWKWPVHITFIACVTKSFIYYFLCCIITFLFQPIFLMGKSIFLTHKAIVFITDLVWIVSAWCQIFPLPHREKDIYKCVTDMLFRLSRGNWQLAGKIEFKEFRKALNVIRPLKISLVVLYELL